MSQKRRERKEGIEGKGRRLRGEREEEGWRRGEGKKRKAVPVLENK